MEGGEFGWMKSRLVKIPDVLPIQVLASLRSSLLRAPNTSDSTAGNISTSIARPPIFPIDPLDDLISRHFRSTQSVPLALTGRPHELLYVLVATLVAPPHEKTVAIVDFEGRFEPLRLLATPIEAATPTASITLESKPKATVQRADLDHVHVLRAARGNLTHIANCVGSVEEYMLYGSHRSHGREWWGTIVIGGGLNPSGSAAAAASAKVAVTADWKGWLRVDRAEVSTFWDMSAEEALVGREKRQVVVEDAGWLATSPWGGFSIGRRDMGR
jgi:hypothetical protein